jgi:hypothetical protein
VLGQLAWAGVPTAGIALFDDGYPARRSGPAGLAVVGTIADGLALCARERPPAMVAVGSTAAAFRYALYRRLQATGAPLAHGRPPSALVAPTARLGGNVVVMAGCVIAPGAVVDDACYLFSRVTLEHDAVVEPNVYFGPGVGHGRVRARPAPCLRRCRGGARAARDRRRTCARRRRQCRGA